MSDIIPITETMEQISSECRQTFARNTKNWLSVMRCLRTHLIAGAPVPEWVAQLLISAIHRVECFEVTSWDDVFGKPHKGRKIKSLRAAQEREWLLYGMVLHLRESKPKPKNIFFEVGQKMGLTEDTVKRQFNSINRKVRRKKSSK